MSKEETPIRLNLEKEQPVSLAAGQREMASPLPGRVVQREEVLPPPVGIGEREWRGALRWFIVLISILSISVPAIFVLKGLHLLDLSDTALVAYGGAVLGGQGLLALAAKYILAPFLTVSFGKSGGNYSPSQRPGGSKRSTGSRRSVKSDSAG